LVASYHLRCSDFHVNGALQIFYDDNDNDGKRNGPAYSQRSKYTK